MKIIKNQNQNHHHYFVRSPSQFDEFLRGFEEVIDYINQCNPYFTLITGDFNARCNRWWENNSNNTERVSIALNHRSYQFILWFKATNCRTNSYFCYFKFML